jgi:hypothetical protein
LLPLLSNDSGLVGKRISALEAEHLLFLLLDVTFDLLFSAVSKWVSGGAAFRR